MIIVPIDPPNNVPTNGIRGRLVMLFKNENPLVINMAITIAPNIHAKKPAKNPRHSPFPAITPAINPASIGPRMGMKLKIVLAMKPIIIPTISIVIFPQNDYDIGLRT
jgi:hypothetical protein